jgi:hypothetical protein
MNALVYVYIHQIFEDNNLMLINNKRKIKKNEYTVHVHPCLILCNFKTFFIVKNDTNTEEEKKKKSSIPATRSKLLITMLAVVGQ